MISSMAYPGTRPSCRNFDSESFRGAFRCLHLTTRVGEEAASKDDQSTSARVRKFVDFVPFVVPIPCSGSLPGPGEEGGVGAVLVVFLGEGLVFGSELPGGVGGEEGGDEVLVFLGVNGTRAVNQTAAGFQAG